MDIDKENFLDNLEEIIANTYTVEAEFKQFKETLDHVINFLPNALWVLDNNGNFFLINTEAKMLSTLYYEIDKPKNNYELEFHGRIYLIKITRTEQNSIISATDITEQKRDERLASMGKVSAHLAHEIRNPIGSISILASTLLGKVDIKNKLLVMEMQKSIYRVERIIKTTLLFTKGVKANKENFSIKELEEEINDSYEYYSLTKDIELNIDFSEATMFGDLELLSIVTQNFLYNALDAIEEDENESGVVEFSYSNEEGYDVITVKDSGVPIKNKNILYEPFQTTKLKGHGLGLALSLEIIRAHEGKIELLEKEKGFKIYIGKRSE